MMKLNHFICPNCGHDFYSDGACVSCNACQCSFYGAQSKTCNPHENWYAVEMEAEISRLKGEVASLESTVGIEWEQAETAITKLAALTALIESDEVAEQVACLGDRNSPMRRILNRDIIDDYRKMLLEGLK